MTVTMTHKSLPPIADPAARGAGAQCTRPRRATATSAAARDGMRRLEQFTVPDSVIAGFTMVVRVILSDDAHRPAVLHRRRESVAMMGDLDFDELNTWTAHFWGAHTSLN